MSDTKTVPVPVDPMMRPDPQNPGRPLPEWVRGRCPECGDDLVSAMYYIQGKGYILCWECWSSRGDNAKCTYRRVL